MNTEMKYDTRRVTTLHTLVLGVVNMTAAFRDKRTRVEWSDAQCFAAGESWAIVRYIDWSWAEHANTTFQNTGIRLPTTRNVFACRQQYTDKFDQKFAWRETEDGESVIVRTRYLDYVAANERKPGCYDKKDIAPEKARHDTIMALLGGLSGAKPECDFDLDDTMVIAEASHVSSYRIVEQLTKDGVVAPAQILKAIYANRDA